MNNRLQGSSWSNPIWHGKWRIYLSSYSADVNYEYVFCHDDYDGAEDAKDNRYGFAKSVDDAKSKIDNWDDE